MSEEFDFFAELNAEIKQATDKAERMKKAEALRKASNNRFATKEQRQLSKAEYEKLRTELEAATWVTDAYYAMFSEQTCDGCGSTHRTFLQYMALQHSLRTRATQRFTPIARPNGLELPRHIMIQPLVTHICDDCCTEHGFDFTSPNVLRRVPGQITVSAGYHQEDINDGES